ncbi:hypothetical protein PAXRUDRAFT_508095 [Paxillus rubicundulus Ve08.2h10]|uniref:Uncharacterized protein n=1 Tax=Paxillus rubicundulus Ve08.2h10 TaxID=930991 RepID=A0A0D0E6X2_9AGAM|nr:hypothetical protein PAXRUDRAFT_508095 [Paxillus rubicundulus Ve08.2h10]
MYPMRGRVEHLDCRVSVRVSALIPASSNEVRRAVFGYLEYTDGWVTPGATTVPWPHGNITDAMDFWSRSQRRNRPYFIAVMGVFRCARSVWSAKSANRSRLQRTNVQYFHCRDLLQMLRVGSRTSQRQVLVSHP